MANIDTAEVAKFDASAQRWWDKKGEFKALHDINPLRLSFIQQHTELNGKAVIDVGCGGGILSEALAQAGAQVTGIDMSDASLKTAKLHLHESKLDIDYQHITAEDMAKQHQAKFDVVTCLELLEHVPDPSQVVKACAELVKPGGKVFFSTINRNPKAYLFAILGAEYILNMVPRGTHDFSKFIRPSELDGWCSDADLTLKSLKGMTYNPISKTYKLASDVGVNYLICCEKP
tara:strand:+ start:13491 stop:14186 length:696 start_codon:yes stop_codon:yes gene_type:complete